MIAAIVLILRIYFCHILVALQNNNKTMKETNYKINLLGQGQ